MLSELTAQCYQRAIYHVISSTGDMGLYPLLPKLHTLSIHPAIKRAYACLIFRKHLQSLLYRWRHCFVGRSAQVMLIITLRRPIMLLGQSWMVI